MKQYYIEKESLHDTLTIGSILADFQTNVYPKLVNRKNMYDGKHKILEKTYTNSSVQPARIVCNLIYEIVQTYAGYGAGTPARIESTIDNELLQDVLNYNDSDEQLYNLYLDALIYGRSTAVCYIDIDGMCRFTVCDPKTIVPVYDTSIEHNQIAAIRFWSVDVSTGNTAVNQKYYVEVYDNSTVTLYESQPGFTTMNFLTQHVHHFSQVPVAVFSLNRDEACVTQEVFTLQDALNSILSDAQSNEDMFSDSILVLKGSYAETEDIEQLKKNKVLMLDNGSEAEYLTKNVSSGSQSQNLIKIYEEKMREITGAPNMNDPTFGSASGVAIRYKLLGLENNTAGFINNYKKCIQKIIELIGDIEQIKSGSEEFWRDVKITFTRNIPVDETQNAQVVSTLRNIVSDETLLGLLPFVNDPKEEVKKVQAEGLQKMDLYGFTKESDKSEDQSGNSEESDEVNNEDTESKANKMA